MADTRLESFRGSSQKITYDVVYSKIGDINLTSQKNLLQISVSTGTQSEEEQDQTLEDSKFTLNFLIVKEGPESRIILMSDNSSTTVSFTALTSKQKSEANINGTSIRLMGRVDPVNSNDKNIILRFFPEKRSDLKARIFYGVTIMLTARLENDDYALLNLKFLRTPILDNPLQLNHEDEFNRFNGAEVISLR